MRSKHGDLLKIKRELILPHHMKLLIDAARFIDQQLNFSKACKRVSVGDMVPFSELRKSIEISQKRTVQLEHFR